MMQKTRYKNGKRIRTQSIKTYTELKKTGELSDKQKRVLKALKQRQPCTGAELTLHMIKNDLLKDGEKVQGVNNVRPRLKELKDAGVLETIGKRSCTVTGRTAFIWKKAEK